MPAYATSPDGIKFLRLNTSRQPPAHPLFPFGTMQFAVSPDSLLFFYSVTASVAAAFALVSLYRHMAHRRPQHLAAISGSAAGGDDHTEEEKLLPPLSAAAAGLPPFMYNRLVKHSGKGAG